MKSSAPVLLLIAAAAVVAACSQDAPAPAATADAGLRAYRDPITGEWRAPRAGEGVRPPVATPKPPPRVLQQPDGSVGVFPQQRMRMRGELQPNGRVQMNEVQAPASGGAP